MHYYFYYGDYVDGERKGNGTEFVASDTIRYIFSGVWDKDAPNGEGTAIKICSLSGDGMRYDDVKNGTLIDGLWDGQTSEIKTYSSNGKDYDLSFNAIKGIPTEDKTEEYLKLPGAQQLEEGKYVYAFDYQFNGWSCNLAEEGVPLGIVGFIE